MKRFTTLLATFALTVAILFRSASDYRVILFVIVSLATIALAVQTLGSTKPAWALLFLAVVGLYTPLHIHQFSHAFVSIIDMTSLVLFAGSPMILRKSLSESASAVTANRQSAQFRAF